MLWRPDMSEPSPNNDMILGQVLGRLDGIANSINTITATFTAHALSDEKNFSELRRQMTDDKEEMNRDRVRIAKITGGIIILATIASYLAPTIISRITG